MSMDEDFSSLSSATMSDEGRKSVLPPRLRLLCVSGVEPSWIGLTLQLDAEGCIEPQYQWVSTPSEALRMLRGESFDCVLITDDRPAGSREPNRSLSLIRAIRASGSDDAIVLVSPKLDDADWIDAAQRDCEILVTPNLMESLALAEVIKRSIAHVEVSRENHNLALANRRRLIRERDEAEQLLNQQRQMIQQLESLTELPVEPFGNMRLDQTDVSTSSKPFPSEKLELPDRVNDYYQELLRTYVIMGCGSLGAEITKFAELLSTAGYTPRDALDLHLGRVEHLVRGLGNRSARHVMSRADLLALELMIHLGESYLERFCEKSAGNGSSRQISQQAAISVE